MREDAKWRVHEGGCVMEGDMREGGRGRVRDGGSMREGA